MHPRNKMRLLAGLTIDHTLEVTEAREVPNRKDVAPANDKNLSKKHKDLSKAVMHLENAVKALEAAPATDTNAEIPQIIRDIEELISDVTSITKKVAKTKPIKESHVDKNKDKMVKDKDGHDWEILSSKGEEGDNEEYKLKCPKSGKVVTKKASELKEMDLEFDTSDNSVDASPNEPTENTPAVQNASFSKGDIVMYDNGIWVVHVADDAANKVGIVPPGLKDAEEDEKSKAMQTVDPQKLRKPNGSELKVLPGPDGQLGTEDDVIAVAGTGVSESTTRDTKSLWKQINQYEQLAKKTKDDIKKNHYMQMASDLRSKLPVNESTMNYDNNSNAKSFEDEEEDPANVVGQAKGQWANSLNMKEVKTDHAASTRVEDGSVNDPMEQKIKIPANVKSALKSTIELMRKNAESQGVGHTAEENKFYYNSVADACKTIQDHLNVGTVHELKKAQHFVTSLMGPILHVIPNEVWKFIENGGERRSLKHYMNPEK